MKKYWQNLLYYNHPLTKLERERKRCIEKFNYPEYLFSILNSKLPDLNTDIKDLSFLVIDFETTGLNSLIDNILSIATTPIDNLTIHLSGAKHIFIENSSVKEETAVINHIVPQMLTDGSSLDYAMNELFKLMEKRILIAHGSSIEKRFILHYLSIKYNLTKFPLLWIDTLKIERSFQTQTEQVIPDYQLSTIRKKYQLPEYITHNALIDTISTGEVFLAQLHHLFGNKKKTLGEIYKRSV
ncbi:exonuclease domain-containing protein [Lonepinella sp. MS14437]|uniref:exonuclease domain-containing protein n=1 Tax=Lonepinella sp. MS14437 TaxID=3003620 RepID=UPI0036DAC2B6